MSLDMSLRMRRSRSLYRKQLLFHLLMFILALTPSFPLPTSGKVQISGERDRRLLIIVAALNPVSGVLLEGA